MVLMPAFTDRLPAEPFGPQEPHVATYVALLRGVNVGPHRRVSMAELRELLESLGFANVRTYLQSGNAVFTTQSSEQSTVAEAIEDALGRNAGEHIDVLVLTAAEMVGVASDTPFLGAARGGGIDLAHLHATFLFEEPRTELASLDSPAADGEEAEADGRVVYLYLPHGMGRTKLNNAYFERALRTKATTRNWNTVTALAGLARA
jgi:uncharacterized protein (DUF1697 family)